MELQIAQKQIPALSPQMILSTKILQMGTQDLLEHLEIVLQENPVLDAAEKYEGNEPPPDPLHKLEWSETADAQDLTYHHQDHAVEADLPYPPAVEREAEESLYQHVLSQLESMRLEPQLASCAVFLAGCLDQNGWLDEDLSALASELDQPAERMERALRVLQSLEPAGIGARNLSECLCLQLKRRLPVDRTALRIAEDHLEALAKDQYGPIARALGVKQDEARRAAGAIRSLDPRPGAVFAAERSSHFIAPDMIVDVLPDRLELTLNDHRLPALSISPYYSRMLEESDEEEVKAYLSEKVRQAKWTIQAIEQRRSTMLACAQCILDIQTDFFRKGPGYLVPMSLADVAGRIGVHGSTVSRAVRDKYLQCPMGVFPMKYFFTRKLGTAENASSSGSAKDLLKSLIAQEDKQKPLSDQKLCERMAEQGCMLSRRTVAKYRDELGIPGMSGRKR